MRIIEFSAENHRSFRDGFYLDLRRPGFRRTLPADGQSWEDVVFPVAAIFGANASGKSNIVKALSYVQEALRSSSSGWLDEEDMVREPFRLQGSARDSSSLYSLDFLLWDDFTGQSPEGGELRRFRYEFEVSAKGIESERLLAYYSSKPTKLIDRARNDRGVSMRLAAGLGSKIRVSDRELVLSRASILDVPILSSICRKMLHGLNIAGGPQRKIAHRISALIRDIDRGDMTLEELSALAGLADLGISGIQIKEERLPDNLRANFAALAQAAHKVRGAQLAVGERQRNEDQQPIPALEPILLTLSFEHGGSDGNGQHLRISDESDGTIAWLALGTAILDTLQHGSVLVVDELDASLHTSLAQVIIGIFNDRQSNPRGGQLIFTTHDVALLSPQADVLSDGEVWFTEKNLEGVSDLYSLADFQDLRKNSNRQKQYLEGRFGGTPRLASAVISTLVEARLQQQPAAAVEESV